MVDTRTRRFCGPSRRPVIWYCSEDQEPLLLHSDDLPPRLFAFGAEGAGKTEALAMYAWLRCFDGAGRFGTFGVTAPTGIRLTTVVDAIKRRAPPEWYAWNERRHELRTCFGPRIQCVSTTQRSADGGAPLQGFTFNLGCGSDEIQDSIKADGDIETRGRGSKGGTFRRLCTGTEKDSATFRTFRDEKKANSLWHFSRMEGRRSPFIHAKHWDDLKSTLSERDYMRRVLALPVGPERATYHAWSRQHNLRPIPIGAVDVTSRELRRWGHNYTVLAGHDPGQIQDVVELFKAYQIRGVALPVWWCVGEVVTSPGDTERHVVDVLDVLRDKFECNQLDWRGRQDPDGDKVLVRADPCGDSGRKPHRSIYTLFRKQGISIRPGAYNKKGDAPGIVPKDAGISVINAMLCSASGIRRLYVDCDDKQKPAAPNLVEAFETCARNEHGEAEIKDKRFKDWSHYPASTRYAFWAIERPRMERLAA